MEGSGGSNDEEMRTADRSRASNAGEHDDVPFLALEDGEPPSKAAIIIRRLSLAVVIISCAAVLVVVFVLSRHKPGPMRSPALAGCTHPVYCDGPLLRAVQLSGIFADSKYFVDMPITASSPQAVLDAFASVDASNATALREFIDAHFDDPTSYIVKVPLPDFVERPAFLSNVTDPRMRTFGLAVHDIWQNLTRQFNTTAYCADCVSSLTLPYPFVVPGGRFREFYYWDSFWILRGLLVSELYETATRVIRNMNSLIARYGFVPNGARLYYLDRSQPPVFAMMVKEFLDRAKGVTEEGKKDLATEVFYKLQTEHSFWRYDLNRITFPLPSNGKSVTLFRYNTQNDKPRPESYREDVATKAQAPYRTAADLFSNIAAGAETGWDFSTRWFEPGSSNMSDIIASRVVPIDLNLILLRHAEIIADVADLLDDVDIAVQYRRYAQSYRDSMLETFRWSQFRDVLVFENGTVTPREGFYAAVAVAGYVDSFVAELTAEEKQHIADAIVIDNGGIPTSLRKSGQQWDFPDAWPPLQWFAAEALGKLTSSSDRQRSLVELWVQANYCGWNRTGFMFEKYDAVVFGAHAGGGEYTPQQGFGWTNGVLLDFLSSELGRNVAPPANGCPPVA